MLFRSVSQSRYIYGTTRSFDAGLSSLIVGVGISIFYSFCPRYVPDIDWICPNLPLYTSTSKSDHNPITSFHLPSTPFFVWMSISYAGTPAPDQSITHMDLTSPPVDPCSYPKLSLLLLLLTFFAFLLRRHTILSVFLYKLLFRRLLYYLLVFR